MGAFFFGGLTNIFVAGKALKLYKLLLLHTAIGAAQGPTVAYWKGGKNWEKYGFMDWMADILAGAILGGLGALGDSLKFPMKFQSALRGFFKTFSSFAGSMLPHFLRFIAYKQTYSIYKIQEFVYNYIQRIKKQSEPTMSEYEKEIIELEKEIWKYFPLEIPLMSW